MAYLPGILLILHEVVFLDNLDKLFGLIWFYHASNILEIQYFLYPLSDEYPVATPTTLEYKAEINSVFAYFFESDVSRSPLEFFIYFSLIHAYLKFNYSTVGNHLSDVFNSQVPRLRTALCASRRTGLH